MTVQAQLNGLDLAQLQQVVETLRANPEKTRTHWRAAVHWDGGFRNEFRARDHAPVRVDEPRGLLGTDTAPNPAELLLGAMGTCLSIGYALNAAARGITLQAMDLELEGDIDLAVFTGIKDEGNPGYQGVRITARIKSDATPEQLQALHEHVLRTSPICSTVQNGIPIEATAQALP
jgi:uncharacterized OsmC-like protein